MAADLVSEVVTQGTRYLPYLTGLAGGGFGVAKSLVSVPQGSRGLRLHRQRPTNRRGEYYGSVTPGLHWTVPFLTSIGVVSLQDRTTKLPDCTIDTKPGRQHVVRSSVIWGIATESAAAEQELPYAEVLHKALFAAAGEAEREQAVSAICLDGLRKAASDFNDLRTVASEQIYPGMVSYCGRALMEYGAELRRFTLQDTARSGPDVLAQALQGRAAPESAVTAFSLHTA